MGSTSEHVLLVLLSKSHLDALLLVLFRLCAKTTSKDLLVAILPRRNCGYIKFLLDAALVQKACVAEPKVSHDAESVDVTFRILSHPTRFTSRGRPTCLPLLAPAMNRRHQYLRRTILPSSINLFSLLCIGEALGAERHHHKASQQLVVGDAPIVCIREQDL
eukprot:SAG31_NODE_408_length_16015_cov_77.203569_9_plen_162_part_00